MPHEAWGNTGLKLTLPTSRLFGSLRMCMWAASGSIWVPTFHVAQLPSMDPRPETSCEKYLFASLLCACAFCLCQANSLRQKDSQTPVSLEAHFQEGGWLALAMDDLTHKEWNQLSCLPVYLLLLFCACFGHFEWVIFHPARSICRIISWKLSSNPARDSYLRAFVPVLVLMGFSQAVGRCRGVTNLNYHQVWPWYLAIFKTNCKCSF